MVPEAETLSRIVLLLTLTRVGAVLPDDDERVAAQAPPPPMTTSAMTTATMVCRLLKAGALRRTGVPFVERGPFLADRRLLLLAGSTLIAGCAQVPRTGPARGRLGDVGRRTSAMTPPAVGGRIRQTGSLA